MSGKGRKFFFLKGGGTAAIRFGCVVPQRCIKKLPWTLHWRNTLRSYLNLNPSRKLKAKNESLSGITHLANSTCPNHTPELQPKITGNALRRQSTAWHSKTPVFSQI